VLASFSVSEGMAMGECYKEQITFYIFLQKLNALLITSTPPI
jgi:hypothetical protein